jgi:hypothetical protein
MGKDFQTNGIQKQTGLAVLISDQEKFKQNLSEEIKMSNLTDKGNN